MWVFLGRPQRNQHAGTSGGPLSLWLHADDKVGLEQPHPKGEPSDFRTRPPWSARPQTSGLLRQRNKLLSLKPQDVGSQCQQLSL